MPPKHFTKAIESVNINDSPYPKLLKEIKNPPKTFYFRGILPKEEICFSIVGTRRCSNYGKEVAFTFALELAKKGVCVVSGMAKGIDSFAHRGALEGGGKTIAVLGTGLDRNYIYPKENLRLAEKILENNGCLMSEYKPETRGTNFTFPQRNRIISGISIGVLVVEAKEKSGALITAEWARRQNKKIFAIPNSIFSKNSKGCHYLIKKGARLVESPKEILKEIGITQVEKENDKTKAGDKEEILIIEALSQGNLHIEKIIELTKLPAKKILTKLSIMEIEGKIKNIGANTYSLKHIK